ncbi:MAG: tetratricopeptide repeat protein [Pseudomonadota bacterium]
MAPAEEPSVPVAARISAAWRLMNDGDVHEARTSFEAIAHAHPESDDAHNDLGICLTQMHEFAAARAAFDRALKINPAREDAWYNLGVASLNDDPNNAFNAFIKALEINATFFEAGMALGSLLERTSRSDDAVRAYAKLGGALFEQAKHQQCVQALRAALRLAPRAPGPSLVMARSLYQSKQVNAAKQVLTPVLDTLKEEPEAINLAGLICCEENELARAEKLFKRALALRPAFAEAHNNLGNCYSKAGRFEEAIKSYQFAINHFRNYADAFCNMAQDLHALGELEKAEIACREALRINPDNAIAHTTLAWLLLGRGDFSEGWREFEWRRFERSNHYLINPCTQQVVPRPSGLLPIDFKAKRVLLVGTGGIGTELFFMRFLNDLRATGVGSISYVTTERLHPLLNHLALFDAVISPGARPVGEFDVVMSGCDLPLALGHQTGDPLPPTPRWSAPTLHRQRMRARLKKVGAGPYLAITWRSGLAQDAPRRKSLPVEALSKTIQQWPGSVLSVQREPEAGEVERLSRLISKPVADFQDIDNDFLGALALFEEINEYVAMSNSNVYIAGATDCRMRILVKAPADWRWSLSEQAQSSWFSTATLYPERRNGWAETLTQLSFDLV